MAIFSIGHSTYGEYDFLVQLPPGTAVLDARSHPGSKWPQFRKESLEKWLPDVGVAYEWWPGLGGWRGGVHGEKTAKVMDQFGVDIRPYLTAGFPKQRIAATVPLRWLPEGGRAAWTNQGLRDYSFYTGTQEFLKAADQLIERGRREDVAIMCCEAQWWRCHRSMVADYLFWCGVECWHVQPRMRQRAGIKYVDGYREQAHSSVIGDRLARYESPVVASWWQWWGRKEATQW